MKKSAATAAAILILFLFLAACGGGGADSDSDANKNPTSVPLAPTNFSASASGNDVTLTWRSVQGATAYNCYYSSTPGVSKASPKTTFSDIPAYEPGQTLYVTIPLQAGVYYAVLTAFNSLGESAISSPEVFVNVTGTGGGGGGGEELPPFNGQSVTTFSGMGSMGYADGAANAALFLSPKGLAVDSNYVYVADTGNNVIRAVALSDGHAYTLAGNSYGYAGSTDGDGLNARFGSPAALAILNGYLYVADTSYSLIRRIGLTAPYTVTTVAGLAGQTGSTDGTLAAARFRYPRGIAAHGGYLYVADTGNNTIRKIDLAAGTVTTIAGNANTYAGNVNGAGTSARFNYPCGLAVDPDGTNLYVCDRNNGAVKKLRLSTNVVSLLSDALSYPAAAVSDGDTVLVADAGTVGTGYLANTITQIDVVTGAAQILAGGGNPLSGVSVDGVGLDATFNHPEGIALHGTTLYVADTLSHELRKIE